MASLPLVLFVGFQRLAELDEVLDGLFLIVIAKRTKRIAEKALSCIGKPP